jgi:HK97 gp10 family phage protein
MMPKIKFEGLDSLEKKLKKNITLDDVRRIVRLNGSELHTKMQQKADFKGHYEWGKGKGKVFKKPTGTTKRSITLDIKDGGMTAEVEPQTEYSPYLEYGTRFMEAQSFVRPALDEQAKQFKRDMQKLVR